MPAQATALPGGWTRLATDCTTIGLPPPPAAIAGRLRRAAQGWTLQAQAGPGTAPALTGWLHCIGAIAVQEVRGGLRARFGSLPDSIDILARVGDVDRIEAGPAGHVVCTVRLPRGTLDAVLATLDTRPYDRDAALTDHQEALLRECVAAGYYSIPRKVTLRGLAGRLGLSTTSLSLTLRRAEARIVASYMGRKQPVAGPGGTDGPLLDRSAAAIVAGHGMVGLDPSAPSDGDAAAASPRARARRPRVD